MNYIELKQKLLNLEPVFNSYKDCVEVINNHGYRDFKEFCDFVFAYDYLPFIRAINNSEAHTLQFIYTL